MLPRTAKPRGAVGKQHSSRGGGVAVQTNEFGVPAQHGGQGRLKRAGELLVALCVVTGFGQGRLTVAQVFAQRVTCTTEGIFHGIDCN